MSGNRVRLRLGPLTEELATDEGGDISAEKLEREITELLLTKSDVAGGTPSSVDWVPHFKMLYEGLSAVQLMLLADAAQTPDGVKRVKREIGRQASIQQQNVAKTVGIDGVYQRKLDEETARLEATMGHVEVVRSEKGQER